MWTRFRGTSMVRISSVNMVKSSTSYFAFIGANCRYCRVKKAKKIWRIKIFKSRQSRRVSKSNSDCASSPAGNGKAYGVLEWRPVHALLIPAQWLKWRVLASPTCSWSSPAIGAQTGQKLSWHVNRVLWTKIDFWSPKMRQKNNLFRGSAPDPTGGAYRALPYP